MATLQQEQHRGCRARQISLARYDSPGMQIIHFSVRLSSQALSSACKPVMNARIFLAAIKMKMAITITTSTLNHILFL